MSLGLLLTLALAVDDPRIDLVKAQLENQPAQALEQTSALIQDQPELNQDLGLDYLQGHLLELEGQGAQAGQAFARTLAGASVLAPYGRMRLAIAQERQRHPEVAAGLVATLLQGEIPRPLLPRAVALLRHTLARGGDCRLLQGINAREFPVPQRRQLTLAEALCAFRTEDKDRGQRMLIELLEEETSDDTAREAVRWVAMLPNSTSDPRITLLIGMTLHQHREFQHSVPYLEMSLMSRERGGPALRTAEDLEARYAMIRGHFWLNRFDLAAQEFGNLAERTNIPRERSRALFQRGRSLELVGRWADASKSFQRAFNAEPSGRWADAALFAAMRLEWRTNNESAALQLYELLSSKSQWRPMAGRAALFLAVSDLVQGRADRAQPWLDLARLSGGSDTVEVSYWEGRRHELEDDPAAAVESYLVALKSDLAHPLAQAAGRRMTQPKLAAAARSKGLELLRGSVRRTLASQRIDDLYAALLLLGENTAEGRQASKRLREELEEDRSAGPYLRMETVPVESWPIWQAPLRQPEDKLLALGLLQEGAPAVRRHFPRSDLNLAFTGSQLLARAGEHSHSLRIAEILAQGAPSRLPQQLYPQELQELLYPNAYREFLDSQSTRFQFETALLQAIIREESRFNPDAVSGAAARGLTQFVMPTARKLAFNIGLGPISFRDLYKPTTAITLGAAYLDDLLQEFGGAQHPAIAAYNAGVPQAHLWRNYCFSDEPEEFYTKVGYAETRGYLRKVTASYYWYQRIYDLGEAGLTVSPSQEVGQLSSARNPPR
ncbi:MAG: lytic transglycosylase domain-containing protein [Acidobacteriota bacterium]|nr:lytic transglycosylase domain-containing protein [Acidobacteriota bacterium]